MSKDKEFMWNYRIIKNTNKYGDFYSLHEVYYDEPKKPHSWSLDPVNLGGFEDPKELAAAVRMINRDLKSVPILQLKGKKLIEIPNEQSRPSIRKTKASKANADKS